MVIIKGPIFTKVMSSSTQLKPVKLLLGLINEFQGLFVGALCKCDTNTVDLELNTGSKHFLISTTL